jgi:NAD(P)-dependent dehydrogenase (short-subunit alcohol dehydrogenase family)
VIDHGEHTYRGRQRLDGLTALVTDADAELGRAVAIAFAREGAHLGLAHHKGGPGIAETSTWVRDSARRAVSLECDLEQAEQHQRLGEHAFRELGRIHILVINTPFEWLHRVGNTSDVTQLERAFRMSLETAFQLALAVSAHMAEGGSIIITAPMRFAHPVEPVRALAANANSVATLAANLAHTLAPKRIRANALVPGPVYVSHVLERLPREAAASFGSETLQGRAAQPAELAHAFVFLAAPAEAGFVNGATLEVTGGTVAPVPALK